MARQDVELKFSLIDGVSRNLGEIQKGVTGLGASLVKINAAAELTGKAFGAIGDVAGAFGDAITGAASVEDALTRVNSITNATVEEQKALQDAVRGAVEGTRFSAEEAAGALVLLAEDGFSASEAVDQLGSVLQFAQANAQSAAAATGALGAVLDTFGEKPAVIGELADTLTAVARGAGTSTKALQEGLAGVGNAADQAGISLNDTIGYLGLLASRGIEGGAAVGNFNKIIREIEDPASKAGQALATLGLQGADFATVLKRLGSDSAAAETVLSALGRKPREALRVLLQEGGGDLGKFADIIRQSTGATKEASDALNKTFAGALDRITNQLVQTRNELLTPILLPLADEISVLSARLSEFAKSPEFDAIVVNFTKIATDGLRILGDEIAKIDFTDALNKVIGFSKSFAENMSVIAKAVDITARTIGGFFDVVSITFQSLKGVTADAAAALIEPLAVFDEGAKGIWLSLKAQAADSEKSVGTSLGKLSERFGIVGDSAESAGRSVASVAGSFKTAAQSYRELAQSMVPAPLLAVADAALAAVREIEGLRVPPEAAKISLGNLARGADTAGLSLNALEQRLRAVREALANAPQGSPEFIRFAQDAAKLEEQIRLAKEAIDEASGANERLSGSSDKASRSLREQASAAGEAASKADDVSSSSDNASESLSNFEQQSKSVSFSLGTMSEAFARQAQEATLAAKSADEYVAIWNSYVQRFEDVDQQIQKHIDVLRAQNGEMTEEDRIRRLLLVQYGNASTRIEELVQLKLKQAEAARKANDEAEREIEIETRRTQLAGGIGTQGGPATAAGPATSAGRGTVAGAGSRDAAPAIVVNVSGAPTDAAGWRDIVSRFIAPELERINRLSR